LKALLVPYIETIGRWQFVSAFGVRWGQRKCRPGRHLGGEVVHLANPTSVTCSAYRDNDDCALCNRLWYCLDGFAVVASGKPPLWKP
jgi:hypothetical protein